MRFVVKYRKEDSGPKVVAFAEYIITGALLLATSSTCATLAVATLLFGIQPYDLGFPNHDVTYFGIITVIVGIAFWAADNLLASMYYYQAGDIDSAIKFASTWERVNIGFLLVVVLANTFLQAWMFTVFIVVFRVLVISVIHHYIEILKEAKEENKEEII